MEVRVARGESGLRAPIMDLGSDRVYLPRVPWRAGAARGGAGVRLPLPYGPRRRRRIRDVTVSFRGGDEVANERMTAMRLRR